MQPCGILIVEDELLVAADLEMSLARAGHSIVGTAESYEEAVALAEKHSPNLVLMDIKLRGERSGIAAATTIRKQWQIPVVFLTANADEQTLTDARSAGPYGFLTKPFRNEELTETIRIAIEQHGRARELFASQHWLTTLLDSLADAVIATDRDAVVRYLNPAAEVLTGWTPVEAEGKRIEQVYPLTDFAGHRVDYCLLKRALASGKFVGKERFILTTKPGNKVFIEDSAAPILDAAHVVGAVTIFSDISERLKMERKQELQRDRLEETAQMATAALGQTRAELRALAADLMRTQEQERHRIARELHDDLGQQAALLAMQVEGVAKEGSAGTQAIEQLRSQVAQLATSLREVSHRLHPSIIADLGLAVALQSLIEQERELGLDASFSARNVPASIPLESATALYRIAQEGLRNASKHAAGAAVRMTLSHEKKEMQLRIQDAGPGFSPVEVRHRGGLGLLSMQERARLAGGNLLLSSRSGEGTILLVRVPLGD